jgi:ABC-type multidrug transport system fused ATPase/permease subunit
MPMSSDPQQPQQQPTVPAPSPKAWRQFLKKLLNKSRRVWLWLVFVGLVAVVSLLVAMLIGYFEGNTPELRDLLSEGDGFLIAIAITADAYGRAVEHKQAHTIRALGCGLVLLAAILAFGFVKTQLQNQKAEVVSQLATIHKYPPANDRAVETLTRLTDAVEKHPYRVERLATTSLYLIVARLITSFLVIINIED